MRHATYCGADDVLSPDAPWPIALELGSSLVNEEILHDWQEIAEYLTIAACRFTVQVADRKSAVRQIANGLRAARLLGAEQLIVDLDPDPASGAPRQLNSREAILDTTALVLADVSWIAQQEGVTLALDVRLPPETIRTMIDEVAAWPVAAAVDLTDEEIIEPVIGAFSVLRQRISAIQLPGDPDPIAAAPHKTESALAQVHPDLPDMLTNIAFQGLAIWHRNSPGDLE